MKINLCRASGMLAVVFLATAMTVAGQEGRSTFVLTSTNPADAANYVYVFEMPSLSLVGMLATGGKGGASGNAGILQFSGDLGAVANFGSNSVSQLVRNDNVISIGPTINLGAGCVNPDSVALGMDHLYVVDTVCAESYPWPNGRTADGTVVLGDVNAAQIAVGWSWAAVTLRDNKLYQLWLAAGGALSGLYTPVTLLAGAEAVPLGEAFWGDILGFTPAHDTDNFAIVNKAGQEYPIVGPTPFPTNAPCWVAKGKGNIWYTGNSPGHVISIFFSDGQGGKYYKPVALPELGTPTDITVSPDGKWLAVIYTYDGYGYVAVYSIDSYGDLTWVATSPTEEGVPSYSGVAFSQ